MEVYLKTYRYIVLIHVHTLRHVHTHSHVYTYTPPTHPHTHTHTHVHTHSYLNTYTAGRVNKENPVLKQRRVMLKPLWPVGKRSIRL